MSQRVFVKQAYTLLLRNCSERSDKATQCPDSCKQHSKRSTDISVRQYAQEPGWVSKKTLYLGARFVGQPKALAEIDTLLQTFQVATVGTKEALEARQLAMKDFEDALQAVSARAAKADYILTRNTRHFRVSPVPPISPREFLDLA